MTSPDFTSLCALPLVRLTALLTSALAVTSTAAAAPRPLWVCVYSDESVKSGDGTLKTDQGMTKFSDHLMCWRDTEKRPKNPVQEAIFQAFIRAAGMSLGEARERQLGAVLCHDGAVGAVTLSKGLPTLREARRACGSPVFSAPARSGGNLTGGIIPDFLDSSAGMPRSSDIKCSAQGSANPWADVEGRPPRTSDAEVYGVLFGAWVTGAGAAYATTKLVGKEPASGLLGTGGKVLGNTATAGGIAVALQKWGEAVTERLGKQMEDKYRDAAESLANQAAGFALSAEADAKAAENAAAASGDPEAAAKAAQARKAAEDAQQAAARARMAAQEAAAAQSQAKIAAGYEAAKKADEEAKKAAEKAAQAKEEAEKKAAEARGTTPGAGTQPTEKTPARSTCETLRRQVWECEQAGWKTFSCQNLARMLQGCRFNMTVALVDGDSYVCGMATVRSKEVVAAALDKACGIPIAHPMPGQDPCALTVNGSPKIRGTCSPDDDRECPEPPAVAVPGDDTVCFPAPPGAPPMPCLDPTPGGGPPVAGGFLQDRKGGIYIVSSGGIVLLGQGYPPRR